MKIDTDIVLWNGNDRQKYRVIISVEATRQYMLADGNKEVRKVENESTLKLLLKEFVTHYNTKGD